ncbi:hypothetical protein MTO96_036703 [Rhipicephalus appendiculatus]
MYQLVKEVINEVEKCGLHVLRLVTDNHKINVTMMRDLGNGSLKPVVIHPCDTERNLFLSFDQCHIIKNVRNLLLDGEMTDGQQPISGQFVKQLYMLQKNEIVKPVRFLTQKHIEPTNFEKMHVGRAVQLFSDEVISALSLLKEYPNHPQAEQFRNADATILFMKTMQKWFVIHNVANRRAHVHMRKPDQMHFFCATDERLQWLEKDFPDYLETLHNACKRSQKKFLSAETYEALLLTSKSTVLCVKYLLESGFYYVLTRNFSSDPVELLFSSMRQMAGGNDWLDARAVTFSLERILRTGTLCPSEASNVENVQSALRFTETDDVVVQIDELFTSLEAMPMKRLPSTIANASIAYIAGFVAKAVEERKICSFCPSLHQSDGSGPALMGLISLQSRGGLTFPKPEFVTVLVTVKKAVDVAPAAHKKEQRASTAG